MCHYRTTRYLKSKRRPHVLTQPGMCRYSPDEEARTLVLEAARGSIVEGVLTWGADANTVRSALQLQFAAAF